jgi:tetratricopeptide (TPR) repeat protein
MRRHRWSVLRAIVFIIVSAQATLAVAQNIPFGVLRDWMFYSERGRYDLGRGAYVNAEKRFHLAIREIKPYPAVNHALMARSYCDLAKALYFQKRYAEAEPLAKWALSVRDADKKASPDAVFQCLFTLASIECEQKHYADAEPLFARALALQEKELPPAHVNTLLTLDRLAMVCREQEKYQAAEAFYLRTIAILQRHRPDENLDVAYIAEQYAIMLRRMNRSSEAEKWQARAVAIRDTVASRAAIAEADAARADLRGFK